MQFQIGQRVRLVPTQGAYQKERQGTVTSLTRTQVGVQTEGLLGEVRYRLEDGLPVRKIDQVRDKPRPSGRGRMGPPR